MVRAALFKYLMLERPVTHSPTGEQGRGEAADSKKSKCRGRFVIKFQVNRVSITVKGCRALTQSRKATHNRREKHWDMV